jgi:hypothetical protein
VRRVETPTANLIIEAAELGGSSGQKLPLLTLVGAICKWSHLEWGPYRTGEPTGALYRGPTCFSFVLGGRRTPSGSGIIFSFFRIKKSKPELATSQLEEQTKKKHQTDIKSDANKHVNNFLIFILLPSLLLFYFDSFNHLRMQFIIIIIVNWQQLT